MLSAFVLMFVVSIHCETPGNVHVLLEDLFNDNVYNKMVRGEPDLSEATVVNMNFSLMSINKFDEVGEQLEVLGVVYLSWRDARLAWHPENYNYTQSIQVDVDKVWMPKVALANPSTEMTFSGQYSTRVRYDHNGNAKWSIADVFKVKCLAAVTSFPFDRQKCGLHFHVYGYTPREVKLVNTIDEIISQYYMKNGLWLLSDSYVQELMTQYVQLLKFIIEFDRHSTFYFINICVPAFVLGLLSVFAMMIPQESGERISYSITVLLSIAIFLNVTGDYLPANSVNMASICYFLLAQLAASSVTCVCSIVSVNMYFRKSKTPPQWMTKLVSRLTCHASCSQTRSSKMMLSRPGTVGDETQHTEQDQEHVSENYGDITWQDVSQLFDSVCLVMLPAFLVVTVVSYALHVTLNRDKPPL